ncbi:FecR family protein [Dyadobacter pollutisoli]|uniref:FecR domain-containing protein n=1 Tax=Dyadobacter pollutisoli TaxID=2910158 RepID=A0A9E8NF16_9BACT|nr:FecR domain-containing protein [Dyadobacter pollutisoli]WAC14098.1 FecR domain-containing protein [Dyadobacter pollutisoli]
MLYFSGKTTPAEDSMVEQWLSQHPDNAAKAMEWADDDKAAEQEDDIFADLMMSKSEVWDVSLQYIENQKTSASNEPLGLEISMWKNRNIKQYISIAASVLLIAAFAFIWLKKTNITRVATSYGEVRHIMLPDSSEVVLNGNSQLSYQTSWGDQPREIWLEGEAFFDVRHMHTNTTFTVHLSNGKNIEVLGTEFNVIDRAKRSCIVLKSGSIRLSLPAEKKELYMKPGDLVQITSPKSEQIEKVKVNPETYSSWTKGRWRLEGTSLKEMLQKVEENYGIMVTVENQDLLNKKVSGSIPLSASQADILIQDIANLFELQLVQKDNKLMLAD